MRLALIPLAATVIGAMFSACGSSDTAKTLCDTAGCSSDTIRFIKDHPDKPFVYISVKECNPDSIAWGHDLMLNNRKMKLSDLTGEDIKIHKNFVRAYIKDTSYAWVIFNNCTNSQGYVMKIPFNKDGNIFRKNSAFNSLDPKYVVAENMIAWTDRGNVFVEDMETGKKAMMTFGEKTALDYNAMHEFVDSVNITPTRIYAHVKVGGAFKPLEKNITLQ